MNLLYIAYKIEKGQGSEDGTGYHMARILAEKTAALTILTRTNNLAKLQSDPDFADVTLIGVNVPRWLSFYKKKGRGIILYYFLWQICVGIKVFALQRLNRYDTIHQMNFHACWAPHFLFGPARIVWGPLTQHPAIPRRFWEESRMGFIGELVKRAVKKYFVSADPFLKWAIRRTDRILLGQNQILGSYRAAKDKISIIPQARSVFPILQGPKEKSDIFTILFIGRFVSLKGCLIGLSALERMLARVDDPTKIRAVFIGSGPLRQKMQSYADRIRHQTGANITLLDWQDQSDLLAQCRQASVFLFPSFEAQGLVVAEALSQGCPVLCLENTGPHSVAGSCAITVPTDPAEGIVAALAKKLVVLLGEYRHDPDRYQARVAASLDRAAYLTWDEMAKEIMAHYHV